MYKKVSCKRDTDGKKKKEEEKEAAMAFQEFVDVFDNKPTSQNKVWVKAGTFNAGSREETRDDKGKLYIPKSKFDVPADTSAAAVAAAAAKSDAKTERSSVLKKKEVKKKSNLEIFKDELKRIQEEREERHRLKAQVAVLGALQDIGVQQLVRAGATLNVPNLSAVPTPSSLSLETNNAGSFDNGDPCTTNVYLGNLSPSMTEQRLMEIFGRYGALASIKIMWPRTEDERQRGRNCGFVAFMCRRDAESAMEAIAGKDVDGFEMKLGWGKAVPIPQIPIFGPPSMADVNKPPPPSGLPFNAQPTRRTHKTKLTSLQENLDDAENKENFHKELQKAVVKVVVPTERPQLLVIHRMVEFVVREGPMFEAIIMGREVENPLYRFLFENKSPEHVYYRWKLFSILQADSTNRWRTDLFRMFKGGSIWQPPSLNPYANLRNGGGGGGRSSSGRRQKVAEDRRNKLLSDSQRSRFESQLRHITVERDSVRDVMLWCLEHADSSAEITDCIAESLANANTQLPTKIARLYLLCDLLHNSTARVVSASNYRTCIQSKLSVIFEQLRDYHAAITSRLRAEAFKQRVLLVWRAWRDSNVYAQHFLTQLHDTFVDAGSQTEGTGDSAAADISADASVSGRLPASVAVDENTAAAAAAAMDDDDVDGTPLSDSDDVDGVPLDGAALLKVMQSTSQQHSSGQPTAAPADDEDDDVDGVPLDEAESGVAASSNIAASVSEGAGVSGNLTATATASSGFVPSRWETVDPDDVAAGVVTTSKWDQLAATAAADAATTSVDVSDVRQAAATGGRKTEDGGDLALPVGHDQTAADAEDDEDDVDGVPLDDCVSEDITSFSVNPATRTLHNTAPRSPNTVSVGSEERRSRLREVEVKVVAYQDDLESGARPVKSGYTLGEQVDHYRNKLMKKVERHLMESRLAGGGSGRRRRDRSARSSASSDGDVGDQDSDRSSRHRSSYLSSTGGGGGGGSSRRSRSPSPVSDRSKRSRRRSRSSSPSSRRRRRSRSPPSSAYNSGSSRRSRSPPSYRRSRSPRSRSRSPGDRKHSRSRKSKR